MAKKKASVKKASAKKAAPKKAAAKKTVKKAAPKLKTTKKSAPAKKAAPVKKPAKSVAQKTVAKKTAVKKAVAKKPIAKVAKKAVKPAVKKNAAKKPVAKAPAKKAATKTSAKSAPKATPAKTVTSHLIRETKAAKVVDLSNFVTPLDDRLIVQVAAAERMTAGGLYIPDTVADSSGNLQGVVVSVGRGHISKKGHLHPMDVKLGDKVVFAQYAGTKINLQNEDLVMLRESEVMGVVGK